MAVNALTQSMNLRSWGLGTRSGDVVGEDGGSGGVAGGGGGLFVVRRWRRGEKGSVSLVASR